MNKVILAGICCVFCLSFYLLPEKQSTKKQVQTVIDSAFIKQFKPAKELNIKDSGFRGIWYSIGSKHGEYVYKYSGGLGTYPSNHYPFSVYSSTVNKTFFCFGGTDLEGKTLYHEVAWFDHKTGKVSQPTIILDKQTNDAHDNPVIQIDKNGYIWVFSTSHGVERPSFIYRSNSPFDIEKFERIYPSKQVNGKTVTMDNFSYTQIYYDDSKGFLALFTHYEKKNLAFGPKTSRVTAYMTSSDGIHWSEWKDLASIEEGHYQTSGQQNKKVGTAFNYHPNKEKAAGLDYRTNLYYLQTPDFGKTWTTANGQAVTLPLSEIKNSALIHDYASEGLNVYINDVNFDSNGRPVILYLTSKGYEPGPEKGPHLWHTAQYTGKEWIIRPVAQSDNNYDMGSLYIEKDGTWRIIGPTETGAQAYNTGGEMVLWISKNQGKSWTKEKVLTVGSKVNHSYARRPVNAQDEFYAFWADGHGRQVSESNFYFCTKSGEVYKLPRIMTEKTAYPEK